MTGRHKDLVGDPYEDTGAGPIDGGEVPIAMIICSLCESSIVSPTISIGG